MQARHIRKDLRKSKLKFDKSTGCSKVSLMTELEHPVEYVIAFDNGTSANGIAVMGPQGYLKYLKLPIKNELSYTKEEHHITRIDSPSLEKLITELNLPKTTLAVLERPMINPMRFRASISAVRCLEAELILIEKMGFRLEYVDSKQWQRILLPNIEGSDELKKASLELGKKLFPNLRLKKDADSLLIAYWATHRSDLEKPKPKKVKCL
jgi:hypothetical protein